MDDLGKSVLQFTNAEWLNSTCVMLCLLHIKLNYAHSGYICPDFTQVTDPTTRFILAEKWEMRAFETTSSFKAYCTAMSLDTIYALF